MKKPIDFNAVSDIYDCYVSVDFDIDFFLKETERFKNKEILELMSGTGRVSIPLLDAGRCMTCVDYSKGMLETFARKIRDKQYDVHLVCMDVTILNLDKKFEIAFLPFHSITELLTRDLQLMALQSVDRHLEDEGVFILTLQNPKTRLKLADGQKRTMGTYPMDANRRMIVSYVNQYHQSDGMVSGFQFYTIVDSDNVVLERRKLEINFRPITDAELKAMIPFTSLEIVDMYGDYSYGPFDETTSDFMIYKMKKRPGGMPTPRL